MLKQRIITALVLLAILLPALFYPSPEPFTAVVLVLMAGAAWEWGRLNGAGAVGSVVVGAVCVAMCAASWMFGLQTRTLTPLWVAAGAFWVLGSAWLLHAGVAGWPRIPAALRLVVGVFALWLAWLAVVQAHAVGINFLLSVMTLVWMADIAAYFAGRTFGLRFTKNKLAPSISPGKSWEGVWGGVAGVHSGCSAAPGCCTRAWPAGRAFPQHCVWWWVCLRCGWPGWRWCRRMPWASISCCR